MTLTAPTAAPAGTIRWEDARDARDAAMTPAEHAEYDAAKYPARAEIMLSGLVYNLRTEAGLTQTELAERAGTRQTVISAIENGAQIPAVPMLLRLADAAGKTLHIEFRGDER